LSIWLLRVEVVVVLMLAAVEEQAVFLQVKHQLLKAQLFM
jgi:hypothetical protein